MCFHICLQNVTLEAALKIFFIGLLAIIAAIILTCLKLFTVLFFVLFPLIATTKKEY